MQHPSSNSFRSAFGFACAAALSVASIGWVRQVDPSENANPAPSLQPVVEPAANPTEEPAGADSADAGLRAKLRLTIDAYAQAKSISFNSKASYSGSLDGILPATEAAVRMTRTADNPGAWLIHAKGTGRKKPADPGMDFEMLWGPLSISWIEPNSKKLMERPPGQGRGALVQMAVGAVPAQITERIPFSRETAAESIVLDSAGPVGGVPCELLTIRPKARHGTIKLWIGTDDHLVRRIERTSESSTHGSSTVIEITDLKLDEGIEPGSLAIPLPEGYTLDSAVVPVPKPVTATRVAAGADGSVSAGPVAAGPTASAPEGASPPPTTEPSPRAGRVNNPNPAPATPLQPDRPASPPFAAVAADGARVTHESLRGQANVLFFFGSWSLASRAAEPELFKACDEVKAGEPPAGAGGVKVIAFAVRERTKEAATEFIAPASREATVVARGEDAARAFGVRVFPTFVFVDAQGRITARIEGYRRETTPAELTSALKALLGLDAGEASPAALRLTPDENSPSPVPAQGPSSDASSSGGDGER